MDNTDLEKGGVKYDGDKIRMDLLPPDALMAIAAVFTYGAKKYADHNWCKGMRDGRLDAAYERHRVAYLAGQYTDEESGLPHLWHMGCCVLMRISLELRNTLDDDRYQIPEGTMENILFAFASANDPKDTPERGWTLKELDNEN